MECHLLWHFSISYIASLLFHYHFHVHYCHNYVYIMLEGLSNITTQTCCLLVWPQKAKQTTVDYRKVF